MLKVVLEAAGEPVWPLLLVLVAAIALIAVVFVLRYRRKGDQ